MATLKLNQIVSIVKGVKTSADRSITDLYHTIQKPDLMVGLHREYVPDNDDAPESERYPEETKPVINKSPDLLADFTKYFTRLFDVVLTQDTGNLSATGTITVDGGDLATDVPVPTLLFIEKNLSDLLVNLRKWPTTDSGTNWTWDVAQGLWRSTPVETVKTKKLPRSFTKYEATEKHAAQTEFYWEDAPTGRWRATKLSGALSPARRTQLIEKTEALLQAVKFAREQANELEIEDQKIGGALFEFLLAE